MIIVPTSNPLVITMVTALAPDRPLNYLHILVTKDLESALIPGDGRRRISLGNTQEDDFVSEDVDQIEVRRLDHSRSLQCSSVSGEFLYYQQFMTRTRFPRVN